ncbi:MAG: hypothetical protein GXO71_02100 [Caldiserica bacterium]|nr:hypothetical protein [Caldisericota bacterium]
MTSNHLPPVMPAEAVIQRWKKRVSERHKSTKEEREKIIRKDAGYPGGSFILTSAREFITIHKCQVLLSGKMLA